LGVVIEEASSKDAEEMLVVINASNRQAYRSIIPRPHFRDPVLSLRELVQDLERMTFYIHRYQGRILGVIALHVESAETGRARLVYVLPGHQRQGIGTALLAHLEHKARESGLSRLRLLAVEDARWAIDFYTKMGYVKATRIERPWGFDCFMEKELQPLCSGEGNA
jgi:GNAT superfamily N-acetyltransferase